MLDIAEPRHLGSLDGVTVLDLSRLLPGGFCSQMLADHGADVIKVEDVDQGDYARWLPPRVEATEASVANPNFVALNRNKRSMRINLKDPAGREAFLRLVATADVVLESFRPGAMARLGLDYEALQRANPRIVVCAISGYGQEGTHRDRAGHDLNYLALCGLLSLSGDGDGEPVQAGVQIADLSGAMTAAFAIVAALHERERSGEGQAIDISMTHSALSWLVLGAADSMATGVGVSAGDGLLGGGVVCYRPYACQDGWVTIGALEEKFWRAWCEGVERPDLVARQFDLPGSPTHQAVEQVFAGRTRAEWGAFGKRWNCCVEPVLTLDEALDSSLMHDREMIVEVRQPGLADPAPALGIPARLSRTPGSVDRQPAPALGEHTDEVLRRAGFSDAEIAELSTRGAVAGRD